ncbi:MAG TPA: hypothetical protein VIW01_11010 [Dehalococcoidia bacterium]
MSLVLLYIDPTAGGLGLQVLLAFFVGGFVTIKLMWARFLGFFRTEKEAANDESASATRVSAETGGED